MRGVISSAGGGLWACAFHFHCAWFIELSSGLCALGRDVGWRASSVKLVMGVDLCTAKQGKGTRWRGKHAVRGGDGFTCGYLTNSACVAGEVGRGPEPDTRGFSSNCNTDVHYFYLAA